VGRTYVGYLAVELLAGNLRGAERAALRILDLPHTRGLNDARGWALYTRGHVTYQRSELAEASQSFSSLIDMRYLANAGAAAQGYYGLALCHQAMGRSDEAQGTIQAALDWALETGNAGLAIDARALASRLELLQGRVPDAKLWAGLVGDALPLLMLLHIPHLVLPAVLLAQGTPEALHEARDLLARLRHFAETTHTTPRLIEIAAMQALLEDAEGRPEAALALLREAVEWAAPRGYIRLFVDLGHKMAGLLERLRRQALAAQDAFLPYVEQILAAFRTTDGGHPVRRRRTTTGPVAPGDRRSSTVGGPSSALLDPLTDRELEVLALLAQHLSNKEIAAAMVISPATVRTHAYNIYQKLNVKGRRQAVSKATELGILDKQ
jgi:LuxR family maltose regulon positive regulatory protein